SWILVALPPGGTGAATPLPDEATYGFGRGSSTLTDVPFASTCSNTRLLPSGRLSTAQDTGMRALRLFSAFRPTFVALVVKLRITGVCTGASPMGRVMVFSS